jgi:hypothetical protein
MQPDRRDGAWTLIEAFGRRVRIGMVGGGADSVIGGTHLIAMRADGLCELTAGAMSVDPDIAVASGRRELLASDRIYTGYREIAEREAVRSDRIDAVVIATPPLLHFQVAKAFLEKGIDVICEKPMTHDLAEAQALVDLVRGSGRLFCLTHCYTGYPMVREARALVKAGAIGKARLIDAEFSIGASGVALEPDAAPRRQNGCRATGRSVDDPACGVAGAMGDIPPARACRDPDRRRGKLALFSHLLELVDRACRRHADRRPTDDSRHHHRRDRYLCRLDYRLVRHHHCARDRGGPFGAAGDDDRGRSWCARGPPQRASSSCSARCPRWL